MPNRNVALSVLFWIVLVCTSALIWWLASR